MRKTTLGNILIDQALPEPMRGQPRKLDKKGIADLFQEVAEKYPDQYRDVSKRLSDVGRSVATSTGSFSFGLRHLRPARATQQTRQQLQQELDTILQDQSLDDETRSHRIVAAVQRQQEPLERKIFEESQADNNPLAMQILSGARGNPMNLKSLRGSDLLYVDHRERPIPIPVMKSYAEGLSPAEYFAGTFGARKGVLDTKTATADAGYLAKQLNQIAHRLVVAGDDADDPDEDYTNRGLPVDTDDRDNEGALLAAEAGGYARNTLLTPKVLQDLRGQGVKRLLVRSPLIGGPNAGVYARDVGMRERGFLPRRGDFVGSAAAQALSEKLTQGQLSSKHQGGVAGADKAVSGFKLIDQLVQTPKTFRGGATHAQVDGRISDITPAPQGGQYVIISDQKHYVPPGFEISAKPGQEIEAGDVLTDGIPNPSEIVRHKGIGEGGRYFVKSFMDAYRGAGMGAHRRNVELLARGLINHVQLTDELDDHVPDDIVPYRAIERRWRPRDGTLPMTPVAARGKYLEKPILHYSIGTKLRPSVIRELQDFGIRKIDVHNDPPPFQPVMLRGAALMEQDPDWISRHIGSNLQKGTLKATHRGLASEPLGSSYVPAMALNPLGFGREGLTQGWKADPLAKSPETPSLLDELDD